MSLSILYPFPVSLAVKSTLVLGAACLIALCLQKSSAAVRHLLWTAAFASLWILPFLSMLLPKVSVPVLSPRFAAGFVFHAKAEAAERLLTHPGRRTATTSPQSASNSTVDWSLLFALLWGAGAALSFSQLLFAWITIERRRRQAKPCDSSLLGSLAVPEQVMVLEAPAGSMPVTCGLLHPVVFLPADAAEWTSERRRSVLLHELAHVRRRDTATHLLARTALALYWWNPLAWAAWREFVKERERAADDLVLAAGTPASEYGGHLLEIARSAPLPAVIGCATVAMARRSQLEGRLLAILDVRRNREAPRRTTAIAILLAALGIVLPVAAVQAKSDAAPGNRASQTNPASSSMSLIAQADEAREKGEFAEAKALYTKALPTLSNRSENAAALIHLGTTELALKDFDHAMSDFEHAQTADAAKTGEARMWMAITDQRRNDLDSADAFYQSALAAEEPGSSAAATIAELYAELFRQQGKTDAANTLQKQASDVRTALATQAAAANPPATDVYRVGGRMTPPILVSKVEPEYSADGRIAKYQGTALLSLEIDKDGTPRNIRVARELGFGLGQKAIAAVRQWKFKPGMSDGQPVNMAATIEINFRLL